MGAPVDEGEAVVERYVRRTAFPGEINYHLFDRWTIGHIGVGTWFGLLRAPWWLALGSAVAWEVVERPLKTHVFHAMTGSTQDTLVNSIFDILAWMLGYGIMVSLPLPKRIAP